jgi:hypothetical protein
MSETPYVFPTNRLPEIVQCESFFPSRTWVVCRRLWDSVRGIARWMGVEYGASRIDWVRGGIHAYHLAAHRMRADRLYLLSPPSCTLPCRLARMIPTTTELVTTPSIPRLRRSSTRPLVIPNTSPRPLDPNLPISVFLPPRPHLCLFPLACTTLISLTDTRLLHSSNDAI